MKVECVSNHYKDIPPSVYESLHGFSSETELPIEIGHQSVVYAIKTFNKNLWYLIEVKGLIEPMYYPHQFFKIIDGRLSKYWLAKEEKDSYDNEASVIQFGFRELIEDEYFYGNLLEDDPMKIATFAKYKNLMNLE